MNSFASIDRLIRLQRQLAKGADLAMTKALTRLWEMEAEKHAVIEKRISKFDA